MNSIQRKKPLSTPIDNGSEIENILTCTIIIPQISKFVNRGYEKS